MTEIAQRLLVSRVSHAVVRLLASVNLAEGIAEIFSPQYAHAAANGPLAHYVLRWLLISSLALPLYAVLEFMFMWEIEEEAAALWIDAGFAFAWSAFFWIRIFYLFTHSVLFL
jgi:hypothetical protein